MAAPLDGRTIAAMRSFAARRGVVTGVGSAHGWFDGFWDFYVRERARLADPSACWVSGTYWFLLYWPAPDAPDTPRLDVFVEAEDGRAGALAPAPVSSIYLDGGGEVVRRILPRRLGDPSQRRVLEVLGFDVEIGHWGPHVHGRPPARCDEKSLATIVDATLGLV